MNNAGKALNELRNKKLSAEQRSAIAKKAVMNTKRFKAKASRCSVCGGEDGTHRKVAGKTYKGKNCPKA